MKFNLWKLVFLCAFLFLFVERSQAQNVTVNFSGETMVKALEKVESVSGYSLMFKLEDIAGAQNVTASFRNAGITEVLTGILGPEYSVSVSGKVVSIKKKSVSKPQPIKTVTVDGTVIDSQKQPIVGAYVIMLGGNANNGAITDLDGKFTITLPENSTIQISCIGYKSLEIPASKINTDCFVMQEDSEMLEDVVVVGYGVQKKESVLGAISQVKGEALVNSGTTNITQSITGKLSGVETFQTSGQPGASEVSIVIRGQSSWNGDEPLVMVDGVERKFADLDPNEVESISVLKDASATAVFGAKGANGVILVTTKTGVKGKPKMKLNVNYGVDNPTFLPDHISGDKLMEMVNVAHMNQQTYGSMFSDEQIETTRRQTNPLRYPDVDWYDLMTKDLAQTLDANMTISGGGEKATYFTSVGYSTDNSIVKNASAVGSDSYKYHRFNYRTNLDISITNTTQLSLKLGGSTSIVGGPASTTATGLFSNMYQAPTITFPAYFPDGTLDIIPDDNYPDEKGFRTGNHYGAFASNPYNKIASDKYETDVVNNINTDAVLKQNLDFITEGLSVKAKVAFTTEFTRVSKLADRNIINYNIDWSLYDAGLNPWISGQQEEEVLVVEPYKEYQNNTPKNTQVIFYWEGSLDYNRSFGNHNVSALALMSQREIISGVSFPGRTESIVGRVTYNFKTKYFIEANVGYTGSEQFSPKNRYGLFPSVAVGYTISQENWWKAAMPWWTKMKIRYSDGLVGSDSAATKWLYFSAYSKEGSIYREQSAANETARWETAHKRDLGIEMGWFDDHLLLNVDLFDEYRKDMLVTPIVTPLVAVDYKDINAGELKKHGLEIEPKYRQNTAGGFCYEVGFMLGFNENRILAYPDKPSQPSYQNYVGTAYGSQRLGMNQAGDGFFNNVDELHAYSTPFSVWEYLYPGIYKMTDYNNDFAINTEDYHPIKGTTYPMCTYSLNLGMSYKGFTFNSSLYGNYGKYTEFMNCYDTEFYKGDLVIHKSQLDYWTPTNSSSRSIHRIINFNSLFTSQVSGAEYALLDHTWRRSDFLKLKEVYLAYRFDGDKLKKRLGVEGLTISITGNNLFTFTDLIEGDPEFKLLNDSYYPIIRVVKLGAKLDF